MGNILFKDTETTGFPRNGTHARDPSQARVCQMALILTDEEGNEKASFSTMIKPDGWKITEGASKVTGLTDDICAEYGINSATAIDIFLDMASCAGHVVAHNLAFDTKMLAIECEAWGHKMPKFEEESCTMLDSMDICKLPGRGPNYKWPKLIEALPIVCGKDLENAHDAMADTRGCMDLFFALKERKAAA